MRPHTFAASIIVLFVGLMALPAVVVARPPLTATVEFGQPDTGSPFPAPEEHDASGHAKDRPVPRTVVISAGGTVEFHINAASHGLAIYAAGTEPEDIDVTALVPSAGPPCPPPDLIDDAEDRLALFAQPCAGGMSTVRYTFSQPGRYLYICIFSPHFVDFDMFGWVIVEPGD